MFLIWFSFVYSCKIDRIIFDFQKEVYYLKAVRSTTQILKFNVEYSALNNRFWIINFRFWSVRRIINNKIDPGGYWEQDRCRQCSVVILTILVILVLNNRNINTFETRLLNQNSPNVVEVYYCNQFLKPRLSKVLIPLY